MSLSMATTLVEAIGDRAIASGRAMVAVVDTRGHFSIHELGRMWHCIPR